jgi:hypothetical protein
MQQMSLVDLLQGDCPSSWPRVWGAVYAHRAACLRLVLALVDELLDDPRMTRSQLRRELADAMQEIEERGP